jgi:hypothetical protein
MPNRFTGQIYANRRVISYTWHDPEFGELWTQSDLLKLGWTKSKIQRQLGDPDCYGLNPNGGAFVRLYSQDRVRGVKLRLVGAQ